MNRKIGILIAVWLITSAFPAFLYADTSYLLIQGPFGSSGSTLTYKFQVNYPTGYLITGQDLLDAVFGNPVTAGTVQNDPIFGGLPYFVSGSSTTGATYASYDPGTYLDLSFTLHSIKVDTDDSTPAGTSTLGWSYYVAGGAGDGAIFTPPSTYSYGTYPNAGAWTFSNDGTGSRFLSNGSFDGWVYGSTGSDIDFTPVGNVATIDNTSNSDDPSDFSTRGANDIFVTVNVTLAGKYTILLSATGAGATIPQGAGCATMMVTNKGGAIASGRLPDGEGFTASGYIVSGTAARSQFVIARALSYPSVTNQGSSGFLFGTLTFETLTGISNLHGTLQWVKPQQNTGPYPAPIDTNLNVIGSTYTPPARNSSVLPGFTTGTLALSDTTGLILSGTTQLTAANELTISHPADGVTVSINPANGTFRGSFDYSGNPHELTYFGGVLFQAQTIGAGFFLGPNAGGSVTLSP